MLKLLIFINTSFIPGFKKFRWCSLGIGYLEISWGNGVGSTFPTKSAKSWMEIPISRKVRPKSSKLGSDLPTDKTIITYVATNF